MFFESLTGHWPFIKLMIVLGVGYSSAERCDRASTAQKREGNLGQTGDFSWLGVLHVQLHEMIATSGIVLIKIKHALVNADDVTRIPQHIFKSNSHLMFLAARDTPWFVKPASYVTNPEYEHSTLEHAVTSIAIIELDLDGVDNFPLTPICLATAKTFRASRYLYLIGFTHEKEVLEKVIYHIQYLDKKVCEEIYKRVEGFLSYFFFSCVQLSSQKLPSAYLCGYAPNSATKCIWNNGMTLVSNEFGYLNLIGFGVHGPGCATPARFIDLFPYFHWINSITDESDYTRQESIQNDKRPDIVPNKRNKEGIENIPIDKLYTMGSRRFSVSNHHYEAYPYQLLHTQFLISKPVAHKNTYVITFYEKWEKAKNSCLTAEVPLYRETFTVTADDKRGFAIYKLTLYDMIYSDCICVRLTVDCDKREDAILAFKEEISNWKEDLELFGTAGEGTPEEVFRFYPAQKGTKINAIGREEDNELFGPAAINDHDILYKEVPNVNLFIKFEFTQWAKLNFEMMANYKNETSTTEPNLWGVGLATGPEVFARRAKTKVKAKPKSRWGIYNWADNMVREGEVSVVADGDVEEVPETQGAARGERAPGAAVMAGCLLAAALRRS